MYWPEFDSLILTDLNSAGVSFCNAPLLHLGRAAFALALPRNFELRYGVRDSDGGAGKPRCRCCSAATPMPPWTVVQMVRLAPGGTIPITPLPGRSLDMMVAGTPASEPARDQ